LPTFKGKTVVGWERYYKRLKKEADVIAESFDAQRDVALKQIPPRGLPMGCAASSGDRRACDP
jgi:hypothetical protein